MANWLMVLALALGMGLVALPHSAFAVVTIDDFGIVLNDYITAATTMLGTNVAACITVAFGLVILGITISWLFGAFRHKG